MLSLSLNVIMTLNQQTCHLGYSYYAIMAYCTIDVIVSSYRYTSIYSLMIPKLSFNEWLSMRLLTYTVGSILVDVILMFLLNLFTKLK